MVTTHQTESQRGIVAAVEPSLSQRMETYIQDPMGGVIVASAAIIGSFGVVLAGSWFIHVALD